MAIQTPVYRQLDDGSLELINPETTAPAVAKEDGAERTVADMLADLGNGETMRFVRASGFALLIMMTAGTPYCVGFEEETEATLTFGVWPNLSTDQASIEAYLSSPDTILFNGASLKMYTSDSAKETKFFRIISAADYESSSKSNQFIYLVTGKGLFIGSTEVASFLNTAGGYIQPKLIDPLQGRQSGADFNNGHYSSTNSGLNFAGSRSIEMLFDVPDTDQTTGMLINLGTSNGVGNGFFVRIYGSYNSFDIYVQRSERSLIGALSKQYKTHHLVISADDDSKTALVFIDGMQIMEIQYEDPLVSNGVWLGTGFSSSGNHKGVIHRFRYFNYALTTDQIAELWNAGRPDLWQLNATQKGSDDNKCIVELLPSGAYSDQWLDSSGNGFHLQAVNTPVLNYRLPRPIDEIEVDSGVFYTDIQDGVASKSLTIPVGYYIDKVIVKKQTSARITNLTALWSAYNITFFYDASIPENYRAAVSSDVFGTHGEFTNTPHIVGQRGTTPTLSVNATGNSTEVGLQIILKCKYIGVYP